MPQCPRSTQPINSPGAAVSQQACQAAAQEARPKWACHPLPTSATQERARISSPEAHRSPRPAKNRQPPRVFFLGLHPPPPPDSHNRFGSPSRIADSERASGVSRREWAASRRRRCPAGSGSLRTGCGREPAATVLDSQLGSCS